MEGGGKLGKISVRLAQGNVITNHDLRDFSRCKRGSKE